MTTLLVAHDFPPMGGGIARWTEALARRYPAGELIVSTGRLPNAEQFDSTCRARIDRVGVPSGALKNLPGLFHWTRRALRLADRSRVDFVWCDTIRPAGYVAAWLEQKRGIPYGILLHGGDLLQLGAKARRSALKRRTARWLLGSARVLVANSRWTRETAGRLLDELGIEDRRPIEVVPLGSDPEVFRPDGPKARLGPESDDLLARWLLTVARLVPHKGIDVAIEALHRLADRYSDLGYLIAGRGPDRPRLEALVERHGLRSRVRFLGEVPDPELPGLYRAATIYVGLSREEGLDVEGFGIAMADAAASGLPVVGGSTGGVSDAVLDGITGLLVDPRDPDGAAGAMASLLENPSRATALGGAGRRRVLADLNWDRVVTRLRELSRPAPTAAAPR